MTDKIDRKLLTQEWVHSHEEDTSNETVFRPSSYPFPRSRGRKSFQLGPNGELKTFGIGADDRTVQGEGHWQLDADNKLVMMPDAGSAPQSIMQLLHVGADKLVVKKE